MDDRERIRHTLVLLAEILEEQTWDEDRLRETIEEAFVMLGGTIETHYSTPTPAA